MDRLLNVITIFSVLLAGLVLSAVRRSHIRVEYSVAWLAAALVLLIVSRWQAAVDWIAGALGLGQAGPAGAPIALMMVAGALFVVVLYRLSLRISSLKDSNIALTQQIAILEFRLEVLDEKLTVR